MLIQSDVMTRKPDHRGVTARAAILRELRRREDAGQEEPSAVALAATLGMARSTVATHVATMRRWGWVTTRLGRHGGVLLTESGRDVAEIGAAEGLTVPTD